MRQVSQEDKPCHCEHFQTSIIRLWLVKEKETQGKSMCTKTSFNKRDEERWGKKKKNKEENRKG